jgi:CPA2 family monovalent cation:H+ antiporter-2
VLHDSKFAHHALAEITPLRDIFATLFFVSLGMLFDPFFMVANWGLVLLTVATVIVIKFTVLFGILRVFGYSQRLSTLTGASLFQIGEFGFLLAAAGIADGLASGQFYSLILATAIITMLLTPVSMSLVGRFYGSLDRAPLLSAIAGSDRPKEGTPGQRRVKASPVILAGYGRIGENMAIGLQKTGIPFVVVDIDAERVATARKQGRSCVHGDISNPAVLTAINIASARAIAVTFPDPVAVVNTVNTALELNPKIKVVARVHRAREAQALQELEGVQLISPEYEASLEFVRKILAASGWQQIDIHKTMPAVEQDKEFVEFAADDEH